MQKRSLVILNVIVVSVLVMVSINLLAQEDSTQKSTQTNPLKPDSLLISFEGDESIGWLGVSDTIMEGGKSQVTVTIDSIGTEGSSHSLRMTGAVIMGQNPYVMFAGAASRFWKDGEVIYDLSDFTGVHFWAKGDGNTYRIELPTASIKDYMYYSFAFSPPSGEWKEYKIPFKGFKQMPYGAKVPWTATDVQGIHFMTVGGPIEKFALNIDQIGFYK